jgi:hypothetical protein
MVTDLLILFFLVVLWMSVGISLTMRRSAYKMLSSPTAEEAPAAAAEIIASVPDDFRALADAEGFRFTKAYSFHASRFGIWISTSAQPPLRVFNVIRQAGDTRKGEATICEFITAFSDEISLTTTTTRAAFVYPRPYGSFLQSFPTATPENLWRAHLAGEDYLTSQLSITTEECRLPFLEAFQRGIVRGLLHVTSIRLWFLRAIYWFLIKRFLLHNRPIWSQDVSQLYGKGT